MQGSTGNIRQTGQVPISVQGDVAVLPPAEVEAIIRAGGFETPVRFFQAGLIHAWFSRAARDTLNTSSP